MSFDLRHFQFARGVDSCYSQGSGVTVIMHTYKSADDTIATITTPGYFPPNIDGIPSDKIFVDDQIMITGTDGTILVNILTVDPITLSANLFAIGAGFTIGAPILPVDAFGMKFTGDVLSLEYASGTYPGIVSIADQEFSGNKTFIDKVQIGIGFDAAVGAPDNLRILTNDTVGGVNVQSSAGSTLQYSFGSPTIPTASYAGIEWKQTGFGPEPASPEVAIFNASGIGIKVNTAQEAIVPVGIKIGAFGATRVLLSAYHEGTYNTTFSDGTATSPSVPFVWTRTNNEVRLSLKTATDISTGLAPLDFFAANTVLPAEIAPPQEVWAACYFFNNTANQGKEGVCIIDSSGNVKLWWDVNQATTIPVSASISFIPCTISYSIS